MDVAVEALGKALTFAQCTKSVRDGGKAVMIGLAATNVVGEVDITRLVRRQVHSRVTLKYCWIVFFSKILKQVITRRCILHPFTNKRRCLVQF